jgi:hypothetical protein
MNRLRVLLLPADQHSPKPGLTSRWLITTNIAMTGDLKTAIATTTEFTGSSVIAGLKLARGAGMAIAGNTGMDTAGVTELDLLRG